MQPGLLLDQPLKSMQVNSFQLIKFCCTRPDSYRDVPAAETKSIGLPADAHAVMVFASPPRQFYHDGTTRVRLTGLRHLDNFAGTRKLASTSWTLQKPRHRLTQTATNPTTGPLGLRFPS